MFYSVVANRRQPNLYRIGERRQGKEEIAGGDQGTAKKNIPNGGVTERFSALFTRPIGMKLSLGRFDELDLCR